MGLLDEMFRDVPPEGILVNIPRVHVGIVRRNIHVFQTPEVHRSVTQPLIHIVVVSQALAGQAQLAWGTPKLIQIGTPFIDLVGYKLYYWQNGGGIIVRPVKYLMMLFFLHSLFSIAYGATINAATCAAADVQAAINLAADGDTMLIPAGTCHWTQTVWVGTDWPALSTKGLTIQGAGIGQTIIVDDVPKGVNPDQTFRIHTQLGKPFRLTGLTIQGGNTGTGSQGTIQITGTSQTVRVDHIHVYRPKCPALRFFGSMYGVVDHSIFDTTGIFTNAIHIWHDSWDGKSYGDGSWADASYFGSEKFIFIEDNIFQEDPAFVPVAGMNDGLSGGRFVLRYNTLYHSATQVHGTDSGGRNRSARAYEIYNNVYDFQNVGNPNFTAVFLGGGTGVIYNNTFTGNYVHGIIVRNRRSDGENWQPFGNCNGAGVYDGNIDAAGYPCLDQIGRGSGDVISGTTPPLPQAWPNQILDPLYAWNNTLNGNPPAAFSISISNPTVIVEGRDVYSNTVKPGYTPYTYPHPLVSQGTALNAPRNLRLVTP